MKTDIEHSAAIHLEAETVSEVSRLHQYAGFWAIREADGTALWNRIREMDLKEHISGHPQAAAGAGDKTAAAPRYRVLEGGVAVVQMAGTMTKYGSSLSMLREGTLGVRRALRQAASDSDVKSIVLRIDSPGGSVSGTGELAEDVAKIKKKKPVYAFIEDLGASAAYYVASQATKIIANKDALVGSIGVYMVVDDWSGFYAKEGVKVHVIKAGKFKGAGVQGAEITAEQLANWQQEVDAIAELFIDAVAKGRGMSKAQAGELADGRVHTASAAKILGLIDEVGSMDELLGGFAGAKTGLLVEAVAEGPPPKKSAAVAAIKKGGTMEGSQTTSVEAAESKAPKVATLKELKAAFPKAGDSFYVACADADMTMDQARQAYTAKIETDAAELSAENARLKADAAKAESGKQKAETAKGKSAIGVDPVGDGGADEPMSYSEDAITAWNVEMDKLTSKGMNPGDAVAKLAKTQPKLHQEYVAAYNAKHGHKFAQRK